MYMADDGTTYSDNFFTLEDGRIINNFTRRIVGIHVRTLQSNNYLTKPKKPSILARFKRWAKEQNYEWEDVEGQQLLAEMEKLERK